MCLPIFRAMGWSKKDSNQHDTKIAKFGSATSTVMGVEDSLNNSLNRQFPIPVDAARISNPTTELPENLEDLALQTPTKGPERNSWLTQSFAAKHRATVKENKTKKPETKQTQVKAAQRKPTPVDPESIPPGHTLKRREIKEAIKLLRANEFDVGIKDGVVESQWGAAAWAVNNNNELVLRYLIDKGMEFSGVYFSRPMLHVAAGRGYDGVVQLLLDNGHEIDKEDQESVTALNEAARMGKESTARMLLDRGANPNASDNMGRGPLHKAAQNGHGDVLTALLDGGASIDERDRFLKTALHRAAENAAKNVGTIQEKFEGIVWLLIERGARTDLTDRNGRTPFHGMGVPNRNAPPNPFLANVKYFLDCEGAKDRAEEREWQQRRKELVAKYREGLRGKDSADYDIVRAREEVTGEYAIEGQLYRSRYERETGMVDPAIPRWG